MGCVIRVLVSRKQRPQALTSSHRQQVCYQSFEVVCCGLLLYRGRLFAILTAPRVMDSSQHMQVSLGSRSAKERPICFWKGTPLFTAELLSKFKAVPQQETKLL